MKNILKEELMQMKYLFSYDRGRVISEQEKPVDGFYDDIEVMEPEVMEPEVKPKTRPGKPQTEPDDNPFNPDRAREFDPFPDLEPQGEVETEYELAYDDGTPEQEYEVEYDDSDMSSLDDIVSKYLNA